MKYSVRHYLRLGIEITVMARVEFLIASFLDLAGVCWRRFADRGGLLSVVGG